MTLPTKQLSDSGTVTLLDFLATVANPHWPYRVKHAPTYACRLTCATPASQRPRSPLHAHSCTHTSCPARPRWLCLVPFAISHPSCLLWCSDRGQFEPLSRKNERPLPELGDGAGVLSWKATHCPVWANGLRNTGWHHDRLNPGC